MLNRLIAKKLEIPLTPFTTGEALYILFQIYIGGKKFDVRKIQRNKKR